MFKKPISIYSFIVSTTFLFGALIFFSNCRGNINYPNGGFDYPNNVVDKDTNFYQYQLKDISGKGEAFALSYEYLFYRPFDEPNLSIKPQAKETFRLCYSTSSGQSIIINLNEESIVIKKGNPSLFYTDYDSSILSKTEEFHLNILKRFFPIETIKIDSPDKKKYLDSLVTLYPQLLSVDYYHKLFDKTISYNRKKFEYQRTKLVITKQQFENMVEQINSSGYWKLPYRSDCDDPAVDGYSYTLEANTKEKYKFVTASSCPSDHTFFAKLCQKIIKFANMDKEINLDRKWESVPVDPY